MSAFLRYPQDIKEIFHTVIIKFSFNQNECVPHFGIIINSFFLAPTHAFQSIYMYLH